jgi:hypothetical protein
MNSIAISNLETVYSDCVHCVPVRADRQRARDSAIYVYVAARAAGSRAREINARGVVSVRAARRAACCVGARDVIAGRRRLYGTNQLADAIWGG